MTKFHLNEITDGMDYDFYHFVTDARHKIANMTAFGVEMEYDDHLFNEFWDSLNESDFQVEISNSATKNEVAIAIETMWQTLIERFAMKIVEQLGLKPYSVTVSRIREVETMETTVWGTDDRTVEICAKNHISELSNTRYWTIDVPEDNQTRIAQIRPVD